MVVVGSNPSSIRCFFRNSKMPPRIIKPLCRLFRTPGLDFGGFPGCAFLVLGHYSVRSSDGVSVNGGLVGCPGAVCAAVLGAVCGSIPGGCWVDFVSILAVSSAFLPRCRALHVVSTRSVFKVRSPTLSHLTTRAAAVRQRLQLVNKAHKAASESSE
jgi:hypothetical protein